MSGLIIRSIVAKVLQSGTTDHIDVGIVGRMEFVGIIGNRPVFQLTHQEIRNALLKVGIREAHNGHFISRLLQRGPSFSIRTLSDLARAINYGVARIGSEPNTVEVVISNQRAAVVVNLGGDLITFLPL